MCGYITKFFAGSLDDLAELVTSIASTFEEIKKANIIDILNMEDLFENFIKAYLKYDAIRSSKMTKECHRISLSNAKQRLNDAKLEHEKLDESVAKLQV